MSEASIKKAAGYVQVEGFRNAGPGYFCGTCRAFDHFTDRKGYCTGLKVHVVSYGCCNNWMLTVDSPLGADGRLLRVVK